MVEGKPFRLRRDVSKLLRVWITERIAIYAPMIYTAPYVMCSMRADPLYEGKWEGVGKIETFLGSVKWHRAVRRVPFGAKKS
jgi:hypothetical protein